MAGINSRLIFRSLLVFVSLNLCACFSFSGPKKKIEPKNQLPFPKDASAWSTQTLLLGETIPPKYNLEKCANDIAFISHEANNEATMLDIKQNLTQQVEKSPQFFHWCYFFMIRKVDSGLQSGGHDLKNKSDFFLVKMKQLWILASALDFVLQDVRYFKFLQIRYLQLSKRYFGRNLDIISNPFDAKSRNDLP